MSRGEGACNRAGEPSEPFFRGTGQGLYAPDLRPWRSQARRRREGVAVPTPTDDNNAWEWQGREDGAYPPLAHAPREPRRNEQGPGNLLPGPRLSKKWLAPLFRGVHSSLAPTARPGSYARKPLLRKAFCGFDAHVAKSDQSLRGLRPPPPGGFSTGWPRQFIAEAERMESAATKLPIFP